VNIDGLSVRPGDLLHADANGVLDVPLDLASEIAALCQPYVDAENLIINAVRRGAGSPTALDDYVAIVAQAKQQIADLNKRAVAARDRVNA
jgi:regulator of RNase E activity RraA